MNKSSPPISPGFGWSGCIRLLALCAVLSLAPAALRAQGFLEQFSYAGLRLSGVGIELGAIGSDRLTTETSVGLRMDWGFIAPKVRVLLGGSYFRGLFETQEIRTFENRLRLVVTDPTQDFTINVGDITWATLEADLDLQYLFAAQRLTTYLGLGIGVHVRDGDGVAIEGTFVEDALDTVEAGLNVSLGWAFQVIPHVQLTVDLRGSLTSELRAAAARGGLMFRFPGGGSSAR